MNRWISLHTSSTSPLNGFVCQRRLVRFYLDARLASPAVHVSVAGSWEKEHTLPLCKTSCEGCWEGTVTLPGDLLSFTYQYVLTNQEGARCWEWGAPGRTTRLRIFSDGVNGGVWQCRDAWEIEPLIAGIEGGGQSFKGVLARGAPWSWIRETYREFPVVLHESPRVTLDQVVEWLRNCTSSVEGKLDALGIACFGPLDLKESSKTYGWITTTPKENWSNTEVAGLFKGFGIPIGFDTDVNAPAVSEVLWGCHDVHLGGQISSCAYITVGTGVGVGVVVDGKPVHGLQHPEAGHMRVPVHELDASLHFTGICRYHASTQGNEPCVESMTCSDAVAERAKLLGRKPEDFGLPPEEFRKLAQRLPDDDPTWDAMAHYLGHLCLTVTLTVMPEVIVLGGGIMNRELLFRKIRDKFHDLNRGYVSKLSDRAILDNYIVPSCHGTRSGMVGAIDLGFRAITHIP